MGIVRAAGLTAAEVGGERWRFRERALLGRTRVGRALLRGTLLGRLLRGRLEPATDPAMDFAAHLARVPIAGADRSFAEFVATEFPGAAQREVRAQATAYAQGFHAARPERLSLHAAALGERADEAIEADRQFRILEGYDGLAHWLHRAAHSPGGESALPVAGLATAAGRATSSNEAAPSVLRLRTVVTDIRWRPGHVEVVTRSTPAIAGRERAPDEMSLAQPGFGEQVFTAPRVIVTLPLGVLQAPPGPPGAVRFTPALPEKAAALRGLVMGPVVKIVLRFREPFWERAFSKRPFGERDGPPPGPGGRALGFLSARGEAFPSWWAPSAAGPSGGPTGARPAAGAMSAAPGVHLLTGWAGGPVAERLAALSPEGVLDRALDTLGRVGGIGSGGVTALLEGAYFHDWQGDPFSRGAYSYVAVGGLAAQRALARPVAATLFFAGEATDDQGHFATVHGAIASGRRAAREVIAGWQSTAGDTL